MHITVLVEADLKQEKLVCCLNHLKLTMCFSIMLWLKDFIPLQGGAIKLIVEGPIKF